ncbi:hypothetical protein NL676_029787 [Syzygium grande]|nr:hypothetical protein NL676_029787 [Syzygium grande]
MTTLSPNSQLPLVAVASFPEYEEALAVDKKLPMEEASDKKKWAKRSVVMYKIYIFKVLKQVHPNIGISRKAMTIMNSFDWIEERGDGIWVMLDLLLRVVVMGLTEAVEKKEEE